MKMFKTSMRGFRKSDVNNYIIELNKDFSDLKVAYELEITELKLKLKNAEDKINKFAETEMRLNEALKDNDELKKESEKFKSKIDKLTESYNTVCSDYEKKEDLLISLTVENAEIQKNIESKIKIIEQMTSEIQMKDGVISEKEEIIANLQNQISDTVSSLSENKLRLVSVSEQLDKAGALLTESKKENESLSARNIELEEMLKKVAEKLNSYESERATAAECEIVTTKARRADAALTSAALAVSSDVNGAVIESAESCLKEFQQFADKVSFTSKSAISELTDEYALLASRAAYYCDILDSSTKKTISEFRGKANSICKELKKEQ